MPANLETFQNLLNQSNPNSLIAGVQRLPSQRPGQGPNQQLQRWDSGPPGRLGTYKGLNNYQFIDDDMPNPFGGGGAPYMPGAMLPTMQGMNIAGVLGESNGRANWAGRAKGKFSTSGPATDINSAREDARRSLYRDLLEPPNPFGGGSGPYLPGAMVPGYPGAAGNIGGLA